jgi:hypothetical protein
MGRLSRRTCHSTLIACLLAALTVAEASPDRGDRPDIVQPGPDTPNFPTGPATLPARGAYVEMLPVGFYGRSDVGPSQYSWALYLRYGVTDDLEFQVFSNGLTHEGGAAPTTGFAPLTFGVKYHLWDQNPARAVPGVGVNLSVQTETGSHGLQSGTQPSLNLLVDHALPLDVDFTWNAGFIAIAMRGERTLWEEAFSWALQRYVSSDVALFVQGYYNGVGGVRHAGDDASLAAGLDALVMGAGGIWNVTERVAVFGSINAGVTADAPSYIALTGFAVAFRGP